MKLNRKLKSLQKKIDHQFPGIKCSLKDDCVVLDGQLKDYLSVVKCGQLAARYHFYGVISNIKLEGYEETPIRSPKVEDCSLDGRKVDVLVIGGGVIGCAILRELSRYKLTSLLVEKEEDVAMQASSRNDGCVHVGFDLKKNSLKLKYLLEARKVFPTMCKELDISYREDGQTVAFLNNWLKPVIPFLKLKAHINHVPGGLKVLSRKKLKKLEPNISSSIKWGFTLPGAGCVSPYELTIALAESAIINKDEISLNTIVRSIKVNRNHIESVQTNRGTIYPKVVINAAGTFADKVADMASDRFFTIHPRKGTDTIMDQASFSKLSNTGITVFDISSLKSHSKGGGVIPTIDRNSLVGPDAKEVIEREDFSTSKEDVDTIFSKHVNTMSQLKENEAITYFSGVRAATYEEDFIVQKGKWVDNIVHAAGIQSPGLTAAPAIASSVASLAVSLLDGVQLNEDFNPIRKGIIKAKELSIEERDALIKKDPRYGHIVCRCEEISEGEIVSCLHSVLPPTTIDGVKRRVRAGMGRCQGGFCQPLVSELISQELNIPLLEVKKKGEGKILFRPTKEEQ
jgi:glycerol-3-phosphate dehydrogenase